MRSKQLSLRKGFRVAFGNRRTQAAEMMIAPGEAEGDPDNRHRAADQWLFVIAGTGIARVNGRRYRLRAGILMLFEHGDRHEVRNTGRSILRTLNIYVPPAYRKDGEELPAGKP